MQNELNLEVLSLDGTHFFEFGIGSVWNSELNVGRDDSARPTTVLTNVIIWWHIFVAITQIKTGNRRFRRGFLSDY